MCGAVDKNACNIVSLSREQRFDVNCAEDVEGEEAGERREQDSYPLGFLAAGFYRIRAI